MQPSHRTSGRGSLSTKWVGADKAMEDSNGFIETPVLQVTGSSDRPLIATLEIDGVSVPMEVNTGAAVSLMSEETQKHLFPKVQLQSPKVRLHTYTAEPLPVLGVLTVQVTYWDYTGMHALYVVRRNGPTLLGWEWLQKIQLDWHNLGVAYLDEKLVTSTVIDPVPVVSSIFNVL